MRCVECEREKDACEEGWVTVLAADPARRISYCPTCLCNLLREALADADE